MLEQSIFIMVLTLLFVCQNMADVSKDFARYVIHVNDKLSVVLILFTYVFKSTDSGTAHTYDAHWSYEFIGRLDCTLYTRRVFD